MWFFSRLPLWNASWSCQSKAIKAIYTRVLSREALKCGEEAELHTWNGNLATCLASTRKYLSIFSHMVERNELKWLAACVTVNSFVEGWRFPVGWCSVVQVSIHALKELSGNNNHKWMQWWKRLWSATTCFQYVLCLFSDILRSFELTIN